MNAICLLSVCWNEPVNNNPESNLHLCLWIHCLRSAADLISNFVFKVDKYIVLNYVTELFFIIIIIIYLREKKNSAEFPTIHELYQPPSMPALGNLLILLAKCLFGSVRKRKTPDSK